MTRTIVHFTDSPGFGGAEQMLLTTMSGLEKHHWRCVLIHHGPRVAGQLIEAADRLGIDVRIIPRTTDVWSGAGLPHLVRTLCAEQPAILHAHLIGALRCTRGTVAARLAGIAGVVATQHLY